MIKNVINLKLHKIVEEMGLGKTKILAYRPEGKKIKEYILEQVVSNSFLNLNFENIEICDVSVVDEVILEVMMFIREKKLDVLLILSHIDEYVLESIRAARLLKEDKLSKELNEKVRIPLLYYRMNKGFEIIGELETVLTETFELVCSNKIVTARNISLANNIAINSASNRLKKLYDYKLISRRTATDESGKFYEYLLPNF
ncbi:hypothetical protein ACULLL_18850 [Lysinibacillus irui]|uniref:hypothetical protein n=1 Tax=Lysinibacillus irui TaxID=2998077 RepID=UPI004044DAA3